MAAPKQLSFETLFFHVAPVCDGDGIDDAELAVEDGTAVVLCPVCDV